MIGATRLVLSLPVVIWVPRVAEIHSRLPGLVLLATQMRLRNGRQWQTQATSKQMPLVSITMLTRQSQHA